MQGMGMAAGGPDSLNVTPHRPLHGDSNKSYALIAAQIFVLLQSILIFLEDVAKIFFEVILRNGIPLRFQGEA